MKKKYSVSPRQLALGVLYEIEEQGAYSNLALGKLLSRVHLPSLERSFLTELVYGTVRTKGTLDWVLRQFVKRDLGRIPPRIRLILRMGLYQIMYLDKVPVSAAVNESVELAKKYGHAGLVKFVNGVLRNIARNLNQVEFPSLDEDPVTHISLVYYHPEWMVRRWLERYGIEETVALCRANNRPAVNCIRANTLKVSREELACRLQQEGIEVQQSPYVPEGLRIAEFSGLDELASFRQGLFMLQDEASMLAAHVLKPEAGSFVIDACAAPGSKTTHMAQLMGNRGKIIAWDIHPHRLKLIEDNCRRLGIDIVEVQLGDARLLGERYPGQADYLLIDAPCSGLGVLRRRPDARWRKNPEKILELQKLQLEILDGAANCLRPGGILVYSTCTLEPEENYLVIEKFKEKHPGFKTQDLSKFLPFPLEREEDRRMAAKGYIQLLPHVHGTDGFFLARLIKNGK
ncbi:16S rRNA (cytosine(967)-C(5))-methyltransferase RsmB [Calderihabitans maritimus]|uniref:16S rRNA (cytosine(967)-C(5))-methyltransferase n=1 Tax=Calderihabitans maritimus TaxID=1246530 RepID=A0A1Z5HPI0_9FIRM|nr:16S rRNA (cytosine(967)-C(5))-methyltransferase RsmB [Calderihabitans maritimus]GAW91423.1 tRNA and rRNA cytosine-C5-methylases [Calderihabitans maritimus]